MAKNRALLLDFLQCECQKFKFRRETYYLSQSYLDRYLEKKKIRISKFQLLGVTCMHLAMKMEEVDHISI